MTAKLKCQIVDGFMPNEKIAIIEGADGGFEEVTVPIQSISANQLLGASAVGSHEGKVLVELPRESASGRWRMWVKASSIGG